MEDLLANDLAGAKNIYTNGKNALPFTIKGFSTNANVDMRVGGNISKSFYPDFQKVKQSVHDPSFENLR